MRLLLDSISPNVGEAIVHSGILPVILIIVVVAVVVALIVRRRRNKK